jgi:acetyltransferase-like isoleucine patch superfamily enzyme
MDRWKRMLRALLSPRAWMHLAKLLNFYHYSHVVPLKRMKRARDCQISPTATFSYAERIHLESRVLIGEDCRLWAGPSHGSIAIGEDTMLGPRVLVTAASYDYNAGAPIGEQPMIEANVTIGRDVWIGAGVVILMGSVIGNGAVIGANSVVRGTVLPGTVVAGVPARKISDRSCPSSLSGPS